MQLKSNFKNSRNHIRVLALRFYVKIYQYFRRTQKISNYEGSPHKTNFSAFNLQAIFLFSKHTVDNVDSKMLSYIFYMYISESFR